MYARILSIVNSAIVSKFVNICIAKKISCVVAAVLLLVNTISYVHSGMESCRGILTAGRLLDEAEGFWQPHGCMMHKYHTSDSISCLRGKKIAFVGDSRMRELMFAFIHAINPKYETPGGKIHSDVPFLEDGLNFKFYWVPELNNTSTDLFKQWTKDVDKRPDIVFQSAASHTIKISNGSEEAFAQYCRNITDHLSIVDEIVANHYTEIFWILTEPVDESKLVAARRMITNARLEQYNDAVQNIILTRSPNTEIKVIESFKWISHKLIHLSQDGLHLPKVALEIESSILLNYLCNDEIRPIDGTCCQTSPPFTAIQFLLFVLCAACIVGVMVLSYLKGKTLKSQQHDLEPGDSLSHNTSVDVIEKFLPEKNEAELKKMPNDESSTDIAIELTAVFAKFLLIMAYFYVCDRTNLFMKGNKHFTKARFFLPLLYVGLLGLFGIVRTSQTALLNRDQTDEWKGWMQLIILIYHMSGASVNVPIYMHIRILVAMYLFMTGYGHFSYFWHKGDYGLYRVVNVVFRLNFLTVSLCLVMDRPYQFYYFVPMCTFWFLVLCVAMAMWPRANAKMLQTSSGPDVESAEKGSEHLLTSKNMSVYNLMFIKLSVLFLVLTLLFVSRSVYEAIFSWWPAIRLFELPEGSLREWWFRCQLDRYAMLHGAVLCFAYIIMKKLSVLDDSKQGCLFSERTSFVTVTVAITVVILNAVWAVECNNKVACNRVHSYASVLSITAFIVIRNVPGYLRSGYSAFFAWFGKISLELFIGQYHIWLAADTRGMLVLISPDWPTLNLLVTSFIFVCVAHEIHVVTGIVTKHAIGPPSSDAAKLALRCVALLLLIWGLSAIQNVFGSSAVGGA